MTARYLNLGEVGPVWAQRISCAGELGWELCGQFAMGDRAWELLWGAGRDHGLVAAGLGCFDTLRLEKATGSGARTSTPSATRSRRASGSPSGWTRRARRFGGREALAALLERPRRRSSPASRSTIRAASCSAGADPRGRCGRRLRDQRRRYGYTVGCCIAYGYLPAELAVPGTAVEIEYFDEQLPATVVEDPLWDPKGRRKGVTTEGGHAGEQKEHQRWASSRTRASSCTRGSASHAVLLPPRESKVA